MRGTAGRAHRDLPIAALNTPKVKARLLAWRAAERLQAPLLIGQIRHQLAAGGHRLAAGGSRRSSQIVAITQHSLATATRILEVYLSPTRHLANQAIAQFENAKATEFATRLQTAPARIKQEG